MCSEREAPSPVAKLYPYGPPSVGVRVIRRQQLAAHGKIYTDWKSRDSDCPRAVKLNLSPVGCLRQ